MALGTNLCTLALNSLAVAADLAGGEAAYKLASTLGQLSAERFQDSSRRLLDALDVSTRRAWQALALALAGDSLRDRLRSLGSRAEDRVFASQVQAFLAGLPLGDPSDDHASVRRKALAELRHAEKAGLLASSHDLAGLEAQAQALTRYTSPAAFLEAQELALSRLADSLQHEGYLFLARVLLARPAEGQPVFLIAFGYFFRRAVECDEALFRTLSLEKLGQFHAVQEAGLASLELALDTQGQRLETLLGEAHAIAVQTRDAVLGIDTKVSAQSQQLQQISLAVQQLLEQHQMHRREIRPGDSLSVRSDEERNLVRQVVARYRALPEADRREVPALLHAIGKLEVVNGDFENAQRDFQAVASQVRDVGLRAEAHFNAYRAALERHDWNGALPSLAAAVALDPRRYAQFPLDTYQPEQILGAGGFGVAFLCQHRYMQARVVVKSLWLDTLAADADKVFTEAQLLRQLDHPAIIRITDCGYVDPGARDRPYLVMDYFEGMTLENYLDRQGPLELSDYLAVARLITEGLQAAHGKGILHRDIKPANLLIRKDPGGWQVKLIDFGLAVRTGLSETPAARATTRAARTLLGQSLAGTLAYAAPEQLGHTTAAVGPPADIYAFARTSCQALFLTTHPLPRHWQRLPAPVADLLGQCLEDLPTERPADFAEVQRILDRLDIPVVAPVVDPATPVLARSALSFGTPMKLPDDRPLEKPVARPIDIEAATSMIELTRILRRQLEFTLFEIVNLNAFPNVRPIDGGGYEIPSSGKSPRNTVHPARELEGLIRREMDQGRGIDPRALQLASEVSELARARLARAQKLLVILASIAAGLGALCPLFGLGITFSPLATPLFVLSIVYCALCGAGMVVLGILCAILGTQWRAMNLYCRQVIHDLKPLLGTGGEAKPLQVWPLAETSARIGRWALAWVVFEVCMIGVIIASGSYQASRWPTKPAFPVQVITRPAPAEPVVPVKQAAPK